jgi:hypothetical protein
MPGFAQSWLQIANILPDGNSLRFLHYPYPKNHHSPFADIIVNVRKIALLIGGLFYYGNFLLNKKKMGNNIFGIVI